MQAYFHHLHPVLNGWKEENMCCLVKGQHDFPGLVGPETVLHFANGQPEKPLQSAYIPVPTQRKQLQKAEVDQDEAEAAVALTSLSTSPLLLHQGSGTSTTEIRLRAAHEIEIPVQLMPVQMSFLFDALEPAASVKESCRRVSKEGVMASSSYSSSTNSGDWSWDLQSNLSIPSTPSPPLFTEVSKNCLPATQSDDGIEDSHFFFGDPIPRKRKNSVKVMFKCLWKNCGTVLSTSSGIQKHIRAIHLDLRTKTEDGEEDFYYTEVDVNMDSLTDGLSSLTPVSPTSSTSPAFPIFEKSAWTLPASAKPEGPLETPLSLSAPTTMCHVQTDHAYQAADPIRISNAAKIHPGNSGFSFSWQPPVLFKAPPGGVGLTHIRTIAIGEKLQMQQPALLKTYSPTIPAPKTGMRKPRGDAKKCRKVYGMEHRDMWCTSCRWKKACQKFKD